jgi:uncharacterized protein YjiS (DUF1127 family)
MARTRDVLDDLAAWYLLPETSTAAGPGAPALPSPFAPLPRFETWWSTAAGGVASVVERLWARHERARQRRALLQLGDYMLRDIGISRAEALAEATRPFWRG